MIPTHFQDKEGGEEKEIVRAGSERHETPTQPSMTVSAAVNTKTSTVVPFFLITVYIYYAYNANNGFKMVDFRMGQAKGMHSLQRKSSLLSRPDCTWEPCRIIRTASHLNRQYVVADVSHMHRVYSSPVCLLSLLWCRWKVIPARGSATVHASFTPLTLSESEHQTRCVGLALGFMSLHREVTHSATVSRLCLP